MRRFERNGVYLSHGINFDTGLDEEVLFLVLAPKRTVVYYTDPILYSAVDLYSGIEFDFHRDSILAENAKPWDSST